MRTLWVVMAVLLVTASGCRKRVTKPTPEADYELAHPAGETADERRARQAGLAATEARRAREADARLRDVAARESGQPAGPDYRSREGWQQLRWGMSPSEVTEEMKGHQRIPTAPDPDAAGLQLEVIEWRLTVADREARASCFLVSGHLAQVTVTIPGIKGDDLFSLLASKYGTPGRLTAWEAIWHTPETTVSAKSGVDGATVFYISKQLKTELTAVIDQWMLRRAKDL